MTTEIELVELLREARRLNNQTVRNYREVAAWHRRVDEVLKYHPGDDPDEWWDAPARVAHRQAVDRLFRTP